MNETIRDAVRAIGLEVETVNTADDLEELAQALRTLAQFTEVLRLAKKARLAGRIVDAVAHETESDRLHDLLPAKVQW